MLPAVAVSVGSSVASSALIGGAFAYGKELINEYVPTDEEINGYIDSGMSFIRDYTASGLVVKGLASFMSSDNSSSQSFAPQQNVTVEADFDSFVENRKKEHLNILEEIEQTKTDLNNSPSSTLPELLKSGALGNVSAMGNFTKTLSDGLKDLNIAMVGIGTLLGERNRLKTVELALQENYFRNHITAVENAPTANVVVEAPQINVDVPDVNVSPTTVNVSAPEVTVNPNLALPQTLESNLNDVLGLQKQSIPKQLIKDDLKIESMEYYKTDKVITDLDGQVMATVSPREVTNIKNVSDARIGTDTNSFELDDEDFDIMSIPDISSIFDFKTANQEIEDLYNNFKGVLNGKK